MGTALSQTAAAAGAAPRNFRIKGIISGYRNHVVPLEMKTQLTADMINDTSEIKLNWTVTSEKEKDLTDLPLGKAEIDSNTGLLSPLREGVVKVTVRETNFGGQSATIYLTIASAEMKVTTDHARILTGTQSQAHALVIFKDQSRYPQYDPSSTEKVKPEWYVKRLGSNEITWSSSSSVLSVNANGGLKASGAGEVTVTAAAKQSAFGFTASAHVSVLNGYIDLTIVGSDLLTDISINFSPIIQAMAYHLKAERGDAVGWTVMEGNAVLTNRTTENSPLDTFLAQVDFLDSGRTVIRAYLKEDPAVTMDYVFNVLPDYSELSDLMYTAIDSFNIEQYTALRWNNLQLAILDAKKMLEERNSTQAQIQEMIARLQQVMLEMKDPDYEMPSSKPSGGILDNNQDITASGTPGTSGTPGKDPQYIDGTSDQTVTWQEEYYEYDFFWLYVGIGAGVVILAGVAVTLVLIKKKKKALAADAESGDAPKDDSAKS